MTILTILLNSATTASFSLHPKSSKVLLIPAFRRSPSRRYSHALRNRSSVRTLMAIDVCASSHYQHQDQSFKSIIKRSRSIPNYLPSLLDIFQRAKTSSSSSSTKKSNLKPIVVSPNNTYLLQIYGESHHLTATASTGMVLYDTKTETELWSAGRYYPFFPPSSHSNSTFISNAEVEYQSLIDGLNVALSLGVQRIILQVGNGSKHSSGVVMNQLNGRFDVKSPALKALYKEVKGLTERLDSFQIWSLSSSPSEAQQEEGSLGLYYTPRAETLAKKARIGKQSFGINKNDISSSIMMMETNVNSSMEHKVQQQIPNIEISPQKTYLLRFDGGSRGNPGDISGSGMVIYELNTDQNKSNDNLEIWCASHFIDKKQTTNNEAEYDGVINGLKVAKRLGIRRIIVEGDSMLVLKQLQGLYKVKAQNLKPLYQEALGLLKGSGYDARFEYFELNHIKRSDNSRADELANEAMNNRVSFGLDISGSDISIKNTDVDHQMHMDSQSPLPRSSQLKENNDHQKEAPAPIKSDMKLSSQKTFVLRFDGGSRGNPGIAGAGMVLYDGDSGFEVWSGRRFLVTPTTSNEAEYIGLITGLECARSMGVQKIAVQGDSELVVKQIKGLYEVRSDNLKPLYRAAMDLVMEFDSFEISNIPREENGAADALANEAMDTRASDGFDVLD